MKKILVAVDTARSGGNDTVMTTAKKLAEVMGANLAMVHVIEGIPGYLYAEIPEAVLRMRKEQAEAEVKKLAETYNIGEALLREGSPATEILDCAKELDAELIVLHSHDPGFADYFLGSVASRVVRHAHCSVHIVRQPK